MKPFTTKNLYDSCASGDLGTYGLLYYSSRKLIDKNLIFSVCKLMKKVFSPQK